MTDPPEVTPASVSQSNQTDAATEALHRHTQSAKDFLRYQSIYAEGAEVKKILAIKEAEIRQKNEHIEKLDSAIAVWTHGGHKEVTRIKLEKAEIVKEKTSLDIKLQQALKEKGKVEEQAEKTKCLLDEQNVESAKLKNEVLVLKAREETLKTNLRKETAAKEDVNDQLSTTRVELEKYAAYRANLVDLDMSKLYGTTSTVSSRLYCLSAVRLALKVWRGYGNAHML
jgi:chromosome segregation ATPase